MTDRIWNGLEQVLQQKLKAYSEFLSATLLLQEALGAEEMHTVGQLIGKREQLAGSIDEQDRKIAVYRRALPPDQVSVIGRRMEKMSQDLNAMLKRMVLANNDCDILVRDRCAALGKDLRTIHQKTDGLQGYAPNRARETRFLNVQT